VCTNDTTLSPATPPPFLINFNGEGKFEYTGYDGDRTLSIVAAG
jgi:hypothetical protein